MHPNQSSMIRTRFKKVLLVAPEDFSLQFNADYENVKHIHALNQIFPSIYELNPNLVVFDYNHISKDAEKIIRRIRTNKFYSKIKICCYKTKPNTKTDDLLKALGVDFFVYQQELKTATKGRSVSQVLSQIVDISLFGMATNASN